MSISVSSFLYKGKNKVRSNPSSYRKISIGLTLTKIADTYLQDTIKQLIRNNQSELQYGFSSNTDFKLCGVLRETAIRWNSDRNQTTFLCSADVSNAFSKTNRVCQLYELWRCGARGDIFMYSKSTYTNTYTVLKHEGQYSILIIELCGSKQGGKLSAQDYIAYNASWSRVIACGKIGLEIAGYRLGGFVVADDSVSATMDLGEMLCMKYVYSFFSNAYDVLYSYSKTILNVYNNKKIKEMIMREKLFKLGGKTPLYDETSVHLGLMMSENREEVEEINVTNRISKTEGKIFSSKYPTSSSDRNLPASYLSKLHRTFIKPCMTSGLAALTLDSKQISRLVTKEKQLVRYIFHLRKKSPVIPLFLLLGMETVECNLQREILALFYNSWLNHSNPLTQINLHLLERGEKGDYWIFYVNNLLRRLGFSDAKTLLRQDAPSKTSWKKIVKERTREIQEEKFKSETAEKQSMELFVVADYELNGKPSGLINF